MATITQRIALTGDTEMKAAFDALGAAGAAAFAKIQDAANAAKSISSLAPTLDTIKARVQAVAQAGQQFGDSFNNMSQRVVSTGKSFTLIGVAIGGAVAGFGLLLHGAAEATQQLEDTAQAVGLTVSQLQDLQGAAAQTGLGGDKLTSLFSRLNNSMGQVRTQFLNTQKEQNALNLQMSQGSITADQYLQRMTALNTKGQDAVTAYNRLGVSVLNADGSLRDGRAVIDDLADAFARMPDGAEKSSLAIQIFGRAGAAAIPFLNKGADGIAQMSSQIDAIVPKISDFQVAVSNRVAGAFNTLGIVIGRVKESIATAFAPATLNLISGLTDFIAQNRAAWEALASQINDALLPVINQVVARLQSLGSDVNTDFITKMAQDFIQFGSDAVAAIGIVIDAWNALTAILQKVADVINSVFGTNVTGQTLAIVAVLGVLTGAFAAIASVISTVAAGIGILVAAFGGVEVAIAAAGIALGALIVQIPAVQDAFNALVDGFNGTVQNFKTLFALIGAEWQLLWNGIATFTQGVVNTIVTFLQPVIDLITKIANGIAALGGGGGNSGSTDQPQGFAGGGAVRGPGTGTSDSILARLSAGEYVIPKRAVDHFGISFFETIRRLGDPLSALRSSFKNFGPALMKSMALPRFASGGLVAAAVGSASGVSGHRPFNLVIGAETFSDLLAPEKVVDAMSRYAIKQQMRSTGRKASWNR